MSIRGIPYLMTAVTEVRKEVDSRLGQLLTEWHLTCFISQTAHVFTNFAQYA